MIRPFSANAVTVVHGLAVFGIAIAQAMTRRFDPERHHRKSIRLRGYDYAAPGAYFVTIATQDRACLFGEISRGRMHLTAAGMAAQTVWAAIPVHFPRVRLDAFVVMPNHVHGVILIGTDAATDDMDGSVSDDVDGSVSDDVDGSVGATHASPLRARHRYAHGPTRCAHGPARRSIGAIVGSYKSAVSRHVHQLHGPRSDLVWQRNYYERIIRDYPSLQRVRQYIYANPRNWKGRR